MQKLKKKNTKVFSIIKFEQIYSSFGNKASRWKQTISLKRFGLFQFLHYRIFQKKSNKTSIVIRNL